MIKTRHEIVLVIDESKFSIVASEPTKAQREELEAIAKGRMEEFENRTRIQTQLNEAKEEFAINKEILAHGGVIEKVKVMFEQKALNKQIFSLQKELADATKDASALSKMTEEVYAKRFDMQISGADKTALKKEIEDKNIGYQTIFEAIGTLVVESKEKK